MATPLTSERLTLHEESHLVLARLLVRERALWLGFSALELTRLVTATSELGRNTLTHGCGGSMVLEVMADGERRGLRLTFDDQGPGIPDLAQAMTDGFSTNRGLGLGLGGARRLVDEFAIVSHEGEGTQVAVTQWH